MFFCFDPSTENLGDRISVSGPEGAFSLRPLRDVTHLYLLAAGTGLTPMTRLIRLATQEMDHIRQGPPAVDLFYIGYEFIVLAVALPSY